MHRLRFVTNGLAVALIIGISAGYAVLMSDPHRIEPFPRVPVPDHPRVPPHVRLTLDDLSDPIEDSTRCDKEQVWFSSDVMILLGRTVHPARLVASFDSHDSYWLYFFRGGLPSGDLETGPIPAPPEGTGMARHELLLPALVTQAGFDRVAIHGRGDGTYCIGALSFED